VISFARRYGRNGSFWTEHPELPYLPVESYEIGNEPDITPTTPMDGTSLHYSNPADFALVYEAARRALHSIDPQARAVVGGLIDSGSVTLSDAERYLAPIGAVDAVGFHPYLYDVQAMKDDTQSLREWLNNHGHADVPLDISEFGVFRGITGDLSLWGTKLAKFASWALCSPSTNVEYVGVYWWGDVPGTTTDPWIPLLNEDGTETPLGTAYLDEVKTLTTQGCGPPANEIKSSRLGSATQAAAARETPKHHPKRRHKHRRKHHKHRGKK
jgi:hypothetical protein